MHIERKIVPEFWGSNAEGKITVAAKMCTARRQYSLRRITR